MSSYLHFNCIFLNYSSKLHFVRAVSTAAKNAAVSTALLVANTSKYYDTYDTDSGGTPITSAGDWVAKYAGALGNSLKVSLSKYKLIRLIF